MTPALLSLLCSAVQELMGHADVRTTRNYTHIMEMPGLGVRSPLDGLSSPAADSRNM